MNHIRLIMCRGRDSLPITCLERWDMWGCYIRFFFFKQEIMMLSSVENTGRINLTVTFPPFLTGQKSWKLCLEVCYRSQTASLGTQRKATNWGKTFIQHLFFGISVEFMWILDTVGTFPNYFVSASAGLMLRSLLNGRNHLTICWPAQVSPPDHSQK